jgi:hypothetical protein
MKKPMKTIDMASFCLFRTFFNDKRLNVLYMIKNNNGTGAICTDNDRIAHSANSQQLW